METSDKKIINWLLKGSAEFNFVSREIDLKLLGEAILPKYKTIFKEASEYFSRYKSPPTYEIFEEILDEPQDILLLSEIKNSVCPEGEAGYYVDKIRERYNTFLIKKLIEDIEMSGHDVEIDDINMGMKKLVSKIDRLRRGSVFSEGDVSQSTEERMDNYIYTKENPNRIAGVLSGYKEIDDYTFGVRNSEFMVICGPSSSGKSMLLLNMGINAWLGSNLPIYWDQRNFSDDGKNVIYVTLEMSKSQLEARLDANIASVRHKALSRGFLSDEEYQNWSHSLSFQKEYKKKFHIIDMPRGSKTIDIEARLDSVMAEFMPDLICIDYLGIMKPNTDFGQDWLEVGQIAADVHELCRRKDLPIISAAQRKARDRKAKTASNDLEDIGRSKMIGDNSNIVLLIEKRDEEHLREDMPVHIVKNRDGAKGCVYLQKNFEKSQITDFPEDWVGISGEENEI